MTVTALTHIHTFQLKLLEGLSDVQKLENIETILEAMYTYAYNLGKYELIHSISDELQSKLTEVIDDIKTDETEYIEELRVKCTI